MMLIQRRRGAATALLLFSNGIISVNSYVECTVPSVLMLSLFMSKCANLCLIAKNRLLGDISDNI